MNYNNVKLVSETQKIYQINIICQVNLIFQTFDQSLISSSQKCSEQAGAELGQAQLKLGLEFNSLNLN